MHKESERGHAIKQADFIMDLPHEDPDSDRCMMARQFLRANKEVDAWREAFPGCFFDGESIKGKTALKEKCPG